MKPKLNLEQLLNEIEPEKSKICQLVLTDFKDDFRHLPGAKTKHQNWEGGLRDHIEETMNIACALFEPLNSRRKLPFTLSEVLFMLFFHDFDKVTRYGHKEELPQSQLDHHQLLKITVNTIKNRYGYQFTTEELNVLSYVHGENKDYHPTERVMLPLTAFVHCCDIISARIWFDQGKDELTW